MKIIIIYIFFHIFGSSHLWQSSGFPGRSTAIHLASAYSALAEAWGNLKQIRDHSGRLYGHCVLPEKRLKCFGNLTGDRMIRVQTSSLENKLTCCSSFEFQKFWQLTCAIIFAWKNWQSVWLGSRFNFHVHMLVNGQSRTHFWQIWRNFKLPAWARFTNKLFSNLTRFRTARRVEDGLLNGMYYSGPLWLSSKISFANSDGKVCN